MELDRLINSSAGIYQSIIFHILQQQHPTPLPAQHLQYTHNCYGTQLTTTYECAIKQHYNLIALVQHLNVSHISLQLHSFNPLSIYSNLLHGLFQVMFTKY